jgi:hypothetical protein
MIITTSKIIIATKAITHSGCIMAVVLFRGLTSVSTRVEQHLVWVILCVSDAIPALGKVDMTEAVDCLSVVVNLGCRVSTVLAVAVVLIFEE